MNTTRRAQLIWIFATFLAVLVIDQITKTLVIQLLEPHMPGRSDVFFHFTHQRNTGLVGGMFAGTPFAFVAPVIATVVLVYLYRHLELTSRLQSVAYGMVLGGALGNLVDRAIHGSVTDFLQFHFYFIPFDFYWKYYPAFNVADSCIVVGVATLVISWNTKAHQNAAHAA